MNYAGLDLAFTSASTITRLVCMNLKSTTLVSLILDLAKAIEHMLIDALLAAEPYMKIANQIEDPDRYLYLTDDIKTRIQMTSEPVCAHKRDYRPLSLT